MCPARWRLGVDLELGLDKKAPGEGEKGPGFLFFFLSPLQAYLQG